MNSATCRDCGVFQSCHSGVCSIQNVFARVRHAVVGGAIAITTPIDTASNLLYCDSFLGFSPQYREWEASSIITVINSTIVNNSVVCSGICSGGGIALLSGGELILKRSTVVGNDATGFGGGLMLGGTSSGTASCSLTMMEGAIISNNSANQTGSQIYNGCGGDVLVEDSFIDLSASNFEVRN